MRFPTFIILFLSIYLQGQTTFHTSFDLCGDGRGVLVHETNNGYLVVGETSDGATCLNVLLVDSLGNLIRSKEFNFYPDFFFNTWGRISFLDKNNDLIIVSTVTEVDSINSHSYLLKISSQTLDTIWTKRLVTPQKERLSAIAQYGENYLIASEYVYPIVRPDGNWYKEKSRILFSVVDTSGNLIIRKEVANDLRYDIVGDMRILDNREIALTYRSGNEGLLEQGYVGIIDSNFNFKWNLKLPVDREIRVKSPTLTLSDDKKSIYVEYFLEEYFVNFGYSTSAKLYAYNLSGDLLWDVSLLSQGLFNQTYGNLASNGDILGCGLYRTNNKTRSRIFRISDTGEVIWDRIYKNPHDPRRDGFINAGWIANVIETRDGGILATGWLLNYKDTFETDVDIYLLKLDGNGCLVPSCDSIVLPTPKLPTRVNDLLPEETISLYPNPTTDKILVSFDDLGLKPEKLEIFNEFGKPVAVPENSENFQKIDVSNLSSGVYLLNFKFAGDKRIVKRFVKI